MAEAVRPLRVTVMTYPKTEAGGVVLHQDVELVKAAVLYADQVELISPSAVMVGSMAALAESGMAGMAQLFESMDDETLTHLGGEALLAHRGQFAAMVALADPGEHDEILDGLTKVAEDLAESSGAYELVPAIDSGLLSLDSAGIDQGETDRMVQRFTELILQRLRDPRWRVLFDAGTADLARSLLSESKSDELPGLKRAGQAAVGSGLVARLPAFPQAPMDELLDLRGDLRDQLTRYRAATLKLSSSLDPALGEELHAQVDDIWVASVEPALLEIRETLKDHSLVRELAKFAMTDVRAFVLGGAGVYMGLSAATSLDQAASVLLGSAGGSAATGLKAVWESHEARRQVERHELFYLYAADKRLSY